MHAVTCGCIWDIVWVHMGPYVGCMRVHMGHNVGALVSFPDSPLRNYGKESLGTNDHFLVAVGVVIYRN